MPSYSRRRLRTRGRTWLALIPTFLIPGVALAQTTQTAQTTPSDEIIVTAQRRDESIRNVPMTIQALSGQTLEQFGATNFEDILKYTANVSFGNNGPGQGAIFMRGLSAGFDGDQSAATIGAFPNVAIYLDDQSMQMPGRNADVYLADMSRVEVLEGPQGTLFGGGAEAGAVRYITNRPKLNQFEGHMEGSFGGTDGGAPNGAFNATLNIPILQDRLAIRATVYDDHHGGYISNVASSFTRRATDTGSVAYNFTPSATNQANGGIYNNNSLAKSDYNPVDTSGGRIEALWDITPDWNLLVAQSYQRLDAQGTFSTYPIGSDGQALGPLQTTTFTPSYNNDSYWNTAWTINGKIGDWKLVYTGAYMVRHIQEQQDYTNYSRTPGGMYYQCTGSATGFGSGPTYCYSPVAYWQDNVRNTHWSHEFRITSPENKRLRWVGGVYYERFHISDVMNFDYKSLPACDATNLNLALAGGPVCVADVVPSRAATTIDPAIRSDTTAFGQDAQRGYSQLAVFGSVDIDILPNLTLTGGSRYYHYSNYEVGSQYGTTTGCLNVPNGQCTSGLVNIDAAHDHTTYHGFKSRGVLTWHPQPGRTVYALFSQGFRPGGFNRSVSDVAFLAAGKVDPQYQKPNGYAPDSLNNFEIGAKGDLWGGRLTLNLSAYLMNWKHVQFELFDPPLLSNTAFLTNGPNYRVKGVEIQFTARPGHGLSISGSATYNDNHQTNAPCLISNIPASSTSGQCITQAWLPGSGLVALQNPFGVAGSVAAFSPHVQGDLRARYTWQAVGVGWFVTAGGNYTGAQYNQPASYPSGEGVAVPATRLLRYRMGGYGTLDAAVGFTRDHWTVTLFGQNLANSHASTFTSAAQFIKSEVPLRPLTYGVKAGVTF